MTNSREVMAYIVAHLAGYVTSHVLAQMVVWPIMTKLVACVVHSDSFGS